MLYLYLNVFDLIFMIFGCEINVWFGIKFFGKIIGFILLLFSVFINGAFFLICK